MAAEQSGEKWFFDDSLLCQEDEETADSQGKGGVPLCLEEDLVWEDDELDTLFSKEKDNFIPPDGTEICGDGRKGAVEWILEINSHHGFSSLTAILAVNYLDRFLSSLGSQRDKPWMMQLAAVACLSLAAKVEETCVPLLLDLQVKQAKYVFEAKTIQRMELLVLSSLKWRMNPVTPLSFLHHIITRLGFNRSPRFEFTRSCENLILLLVSDSEFRWCPPSVLATTTVLHVSRTEEAAVDYENQLLSLLKISKEEVKKCYQLLSDKLSNRWDASKKHKNYTPEMH